MDDHQRLTLQSLLKTTEGVPLRHRMEALEVGANTHYQLYKQEGDAEGMEIYGPLLELIRSAQSPEDLWKALESGE